MWVFGLLNHIIYVSISYIICQYMIYRILLKNKFYTSPACIFFLYKTSCEFPRVSVRSKLCINKQIYIYIVTCDTSETRGTHNLFYILKYFTIILKVYQHLID